MTYGTEGIHFTCIFFQYIVENSVEERMMELQEKKRKLAQGVFGGGAEKQTAEQKRQQRINDIKSLMDLN